MTTTTLTVADILTLTTQRDQIQAQIDAGMIALNLDAKSLKKIVKARENADAAARTLAALMGDTQ